MGPVRPGHPALPGSVQGCGAFTELRRPRRPAGGSVAESGPGAARLLERVGFLLLAELLGGAPWDLSATGSGSSHWKPRVSQGSRGVCFSAERAGRPGPGPQRGLSPGVCALDLISHHGGYRSLQKADRLLETHRRIEQCFLPLRHSHKL